MTLGFSTHAYAVATPVYEGPLDLLLQLIERAELDITRLALAQVTDQYLEHLRMMQESAAVSVEEVSAFLVIAARLIQIKSEALLPRPPVREVGEEDPGEALARQLRLYKRFKELAALLGRREAAILRTYPRLAPPPKVEASLDLGSLTLAGLAEAAWGVFSRQDMRPTLSSVVSAPRVTLREKIAVINHHLHEYGRGTFSQLLGGPAGRLDVVVTFLALLELIKRSLILVRQDDLFGEIEFKPSETWDENIPLDLEFGE